jgi:hypothetical protein
MHTELLSETPKGKYHAEDLGIDEKVILELTLWK